MRPKGKLFALFAVFAAIGLVTASGAFTTVEADRTAEINAAGDANALLALEDAGSDNADDYVDSSGSQIELYLDGSSNQNADDADSDASGQGVNLDAVTTADDLITITNQGSQTVYVYIETDESTVASTDGRVVTFHNGSSPGYDTNSNITTSENAYQLSTGTSVTVSMQIDTTDQGDISGELVNEVTVVANESNPST